MGGCRLIRFLKHQQWFDLIFDLTGLERVLLGWSLCFLAWGPAFLKNAVYPWWIHWRPVQQLFNVQDWIYTFHCRRMGNREIIIWCNWVFLTFVRLRLEIQEKESTTKSSWKLGFLGQMKPKLLTLAAYMFRLVTVVFFVSHPRLNVSITWARHVGVCPWWHWVG